MKKIPLEEIRQFILSQPDEQEVNLFKGFSHLAGPRCILAQYCGQNNIPYNYCGFDSAENEGKVVMVVVDGDSIVNIKTLFKPPYGTHSDFSFEDIGLDDCANGLTVTFKTVKEKLK